MSLPNTQNTKLGSGPRLLLESRIRKNIKLKLGPNTLQAINRTAALLIPKELGGICTSQLGDLSWGRFWN